MRQHRSLIPPSFRRLLSGADDRPAIRNEALRYSIPRRTTRRANVGVPAKVAHRVAPALTASSGLDRCRPAGTREATERPSLLPSHFPR